MLMWDTLKFQSPESCVLFARRAAHCTMTGRPALECCKQEPVLLEDSGCIVLSTGSEVSLLSMQDVPAWVTGVHGIIMNFTGKSSSSHIL